MLPITQKISPKKIFVKKKSKKYFFEKFLRKISEILMGTYVLSEVSSLSFDLDGSFQEFLEFADLHNTVFDWVSAIDGKSVANLLGLLSGLLHWSHFDFLVPIRQV